MSELFFRKTYKEFFDFVSDAKDELIILSPYIKLEPLKLLLEKVKPEIKVIVVARWKIGDLVFGSTDIEIFEYLSRLNHGFYINNKIHLKIIVKDKKSILVGSANITGSGLGLFESSNIEAIAIDNLDEKYLPSVYSILRESILVDRNLVEKISKELEPFSNIKNDQNKVKLKLENIEKTFFDKPGNNILVYDFPFTPNPKYLINVAGNEGSDENANHDRNIFKLASGNIAWESLKKAFLESGAYLWQMENIKDSVSFGKYSEILHNALVDNPKPYRKQVKELVANMFNWTKELSEDFEITKPNYSSVMIRK